MQRGRWRRRNDGSICDAEWVNEVEVTFTDGTFGCEASRMVSITCEWDADGGMARGPERVAGAPSPAAGDANNQDFFLKCTAS